MEPTADVLLSLVAVQVLGGRGVPAGADVLKGFARVIPEAVRQGWLTEASVSAGGPKGRRKVKQLSLTEAGERLLRESTRPEVVAAQALARLAGFERGIEAEREALREQVLAALPARGKDAGTAKLAKEVEGLAKTVGDLAARLARLEAALAAGGADAVLARIDQAFAALGARLEQARQEFGGAARPGAAAPAPSGPPSLRAVLRAAYDKFCRFIEFQDGLVDVPRLYHEARRTLPALTVPELHRELLALGDSREIELHGMNEIHRAAEPDLGIRRNDKLLYFVYWKRS